MSSVSDKGVELRNNNCYAMTPTHMHTDTHFRFSKTKTACRHICQKRGLHLHPQLVLDKDPISIVERPHFWGLILKRGCPLFPHVKYVKIIFGKI